ncbi:MAG: hypothetical protein HUU20_09910 [Pirellulales bacterium]|nr:hypothetical protein [Pirellulales bacterium]
MALRLAHSIVALAAMAGPLSAAEPGLVAKYTFDEGAGETLQDVSGNNHHGAIHHAEWVQSVRGHALAFRDAASYVDCGLDLARRLTADMTLVAWVKLDSLAYPDTSTNWTLVDCEEYTKSGFIVRIDGQATKFYYRAGSAGSVPDCLSTSIIENGKYHHLAVSRQGKQVALFIDGLPETTVTAEPPASPAVPFRISSPSQPFRGIIDELTVYGRVLSRDEILASYKRDAAAYGKDTSWFGALEIEPFFYLDRGKATVAVNFLGVLPMPQGATAAVELGAPGKPPVRSICVVSVSHAPDTAKTPPDPRPQSAEIIPESGKRDFDFDLAGLPEGEYEIRARVRDAEGKPIAEKRLPFRYPPAPVNVPSPAETMLPALPAARGPLPLEVQIGPDGELTFRAKGRSYRVQSEFSYPGGGFYAFGAPSAWKPAAKQLGPAAHSVTASGKDYAVSRRIELQPGRAVIQDTIQNLTAEPLGVLVRNHLMPVPGALREARVAGYPSGSNMPRRSIKTNPTIFLPDEDGGVGLVALDDVFIVQAMATLEGGKATLHSDTFALDKNASYTLEWAVYLTPSADYYDFINQVRRDEGRNGIVDGGIGFVTRGPADRRSIPTREAIAIRNLKYLLIHCLSYAADDPGVSIEGIEFLDFPKERAQLKEQFAAIHREFPELKIAFHVAHSLYATNRPDRLFADSRVIDARGKHAVYTADPGSYFSRQRRDEGWNWYIYYPTLDNSFGRAMLHSVDVMIDEIGADGPFMDGFMWAYGGEYTYDRWDGHTAQIDPKTKTIARTMGSVLLLSQDALVAFCRKVRAKGGVVVANNSIITRTIAREGYILHDKECFAGPELHLAPTPMALSLPSAIRSEPDVFRDVLDKLRWGNLYVYYEEGRLTYPSAPAEMYPITFEEIHSGYVKGTQRLVTMHPGLYGWPGDRQLHFAHRYDSRGVQVAHAFLTTVDSAGVRTQVDLGKNECAVIKRIPLTIESSSPVNVHVEKYNDNSIELHANAAGPAVLTVAGGDFPLRPQAAYAVSAGPQTKRLAAGADGMLAIEINGPSHVRVVPAADR